MVLSGIDMKNKSNPINVIRDPLQTVSDSDLFYIISNVPVATASTGLRPALGDSTLYISA
jgi:hypothetical protein